MRSGARSHDLGVGRRVGEALLAPGRVAALRPLAPPAPRPGAHPHPCGARLVVTSTVFTSSMPLPSAAVSGVVTTTTSSMWTLTSGVAMAQRTGGARAPGLQGNRGAQGLHGDLATF